MNYRYEVRVGDLRGGDRFRALSWPRGTPPAEKTAGEIVFLSIQRDGHRVRAMETESGRVLELSAYSLARVLALA